MLVFKYFFKIIKKYWLTILMFTAVLIIFGIFSLKNNQSTSNFTAMKPNIMIVNEDETIGFTKSLLVYLKQNTHIKAVEKEEDALFYREISYIIYIPKNYHRDFMAGKNPSLTVKSAGDYEASLVRLLLDDYLQTAQTYLDTGFSEKEILEKLEYVLQQNVAIDVTSNLDESFLSQLSFYYNFANYSILAVCIFVVATVMSSFKQQNIRNRIFVSPLSPSSYNRSIFAGIVVMGIGLWAIYLLISFILLKGSIFSWHGALYALNSFIFTICALALAFLIGNILKKKEAISGISNVISLGSSFLCGCFVPIEFIPSTVLKFAQILPSYWYVQNNEFIKTLETISIQTLQPFLLHLLILLGFTIVFLIIASFYARKKEN